MSDLLLENPEFIERVASRGDSNRKKGGEEWQKGISLVPPSREPSELKLAWIISWSRETLGPLWG